MPKPPRYLLARLLERDANNLDLIRLVCACLVIFGHAPLMANYPDHPFGDPFSRWLSFDSVYAGSIAVRVFFFISGLLVTNSLLKKRSPAGFLLARILRIWPALILLLLSTVFIVAPPISTYSAGEYFTHLATYRYLWENFLLRTNDSLPGVFAGDQINGSLWTLSYEFQCYAALLVLFCLRVTSRPWLSVLVVLSLAVEPLLPHSILFPGMDPVLQLRYLPVMFGFGAVLAIFKDRITLGPETPLVGTVIFLLLKTSFLGQLLFFLLLFLTLLYVSALPFVRKIRLRADLSYGTYLWGFLIQQVVVGQFPELGFGYHLLFSLLLAVSMGFISWHLVEKHAIALGNRWTKLLQKRELAPSATAPIPAAVYPKVPSL